MLKRSNFLDKLPYFYDNGFTRPFLQATEEERNILFNEIEDTLNQFFAESATWGLEYWERMLCIKTDENKSYKNRRSIVLAKMKTARTSTIEVIRGLCLSFFNVTNAYVYEDNNNYCFYVELENPNFQVNTIKEFCDTLNLYSPAHLNYRIIFSNKSNVEIYTNKRVTRSTTPICGVTHVGTWWKSFNEGNTFKSSIINDKSKYCYVQGIICGLYVIEGSEKDYNVAIVGKAIVGKSTVGRGD